MQVTSIIKILIAVFAFFAVINVFLMTQSTTSINNLNNAHEARHSANLQYQNNMIDSGQHIARMIELESVLDRYGREADIYNWMVIIVSFMFAFAGVAGTTLLLREVENALEKEKKAAQITRQEEKLRNTAQEENRAKTQFLARMSHEIRTPMNAVLGIAEIELLKANHTKEAEEAFLRIHSSSKLLLAVINDILDMSKVEAGKMEIVPAPYDITPTIMDTVTLNLTHIGDKDLDFKLDVNENIPASLIGDELRIKQVLNNFLSNAFKYTERGVITLSIGKVGHVSEGSEVSLVFTVTDTGQGMSPEEISKLFESEYQRFNVEANRAIEGTGLGMSIARQLISMMDGKISVKSAVGEGSVFTISIPQIVNGTAVLGKEAKENLQSMKAIGANKTSSIAAEPMPYGKVLAVDDIESNLYVIEGYLLPYQLTLDTVSSGREAIDKIEAGEVYDIIFMDHMMPEMDGIQATKMIRDRGYTQPIVALTANTIKGAKELFLENGFTDFIAKPIDVLQLNAQLLQYIRDKQSPEVLETARAMSANPHAVAQSESVLSEKIVLSFIRDAKKALEIMQQFLLLKNPSAADIKPLTIQAHGMKSALANIQKYILSETAKTIEDAGKQGDVQTIIAHTPDFIKAVQGIIEELSPPEPDANVPDSNPQLLAAQLKIIEDACEAYNKKAANAALKTLKQESWSPETKNLLTEIESKLLHSEFEEISEIIGAHGAQRIP